MSVRLGFVSLEVRWWIVLACVLGLALSPWILEALLIPLAYLVLLLHEVGHAVAQRAMFGVKSTVRLFGVLRGRSISILPRPATRRERVIFLLSGPLTGISAGLTLLALSVGLALGWVFVVGSCIITSFHVYNLTPIKDGSDGSVIWKG